MWWRPAPTPTPAELDTEFGMLAFVPAVPMEKGARAAISVRPENIKVASEAPVTNANVLHGKLHDAVFMGDAYHCQVKVREQLIRVHTHPSNAVPVGADIYLTLDPENCKRIAGGRHGRHGRHHAGRLVFVFSVVSHKYGL